MLDVILKTLKAGTVIQEPTERSEDLEFFLNDDDGDDNDEFLRDRVWIEADIPIEWFGCNFTIDELGRWANPDDEIEREAGIQEWAKKQGGWTQALTISPVVATLENDQLEFIDGWHRSKLAKLDGHTTVRTAVGVRPELYQSAIN